MQSQVGTNNDLIQEIDAEHRRVSAAQRRFLSLIAEVDKTQVWEDDGARDLAHWLWIRYGISWWKADRWIQAAHALEALPLIAEAFASGELGIDKVVELTRFATPGTEEALIPWAQDVSCGAIRRQGDLALRPSRLEAQDADQCRRVSWRFFEDSTRFGLSAELPAAQGAVVAKALDRLADDLPVMPGEEKAWDAEARRADALVALCSARIAQDADPDRATVVIHAPLDALAGDDRVCELEGGPPIHPETARRLLCSARVQVVVEDASGHPVGVGRIMRDPPDWMLRQLRYRDYGCIFPGCGTRRFTQAHHIRWWEHGGRTDLDNLVLVCSFHHKLVHEYGWRLRRDKDGLVRWFRPDGTRHHAGPAPPKERTEPELCAVIG